MVNGDYLFFFASKGMSMCGARRCANYNARIFNCSAEYMKSELSRQKMHFNEIFGLYLP